MDANPSFEVPKLACNWPYLQQALKWSFPFFFFFFFALVLFLIIEAKKKKKEKKNYINTFIWLQDPVK